jgi:urease accessory protein UreE
MRDEFVLIVYESVAAISEQNLRGKEEDTLALTWEQRRWTRGKFTTKKGREIAVALPTGTPLRPGAIILVGPEWYVRVEAIAEPLIAVKPDDYRQAIKLAFEIGNRHFALALDGETIMVPDDLVMTQLFDRLNIPWSRRRAVFSPLGNGLIHGR